MQFLDFTMAVEFKNTSADVNSTFKDVAACKFRLNQANDELSNVEAVDYNTQSSAYSDLLTL